MDIDDLDTTAESKTNSDLSSISADLSSMSGDTKPNIQPSANGNAEMLVRSIWLWSYKMHLEVFAEVVS